MGRASKASVLFEEISESNAGSFNTLLCGLMSNGRLYKAIKFSGGMVKKIFCTAMIHGLIVNELHQTDLGLLFKMVEAGMKPNDLTVVIAFSARIKAGALETGRKIHDNIFNKGLYLIATVDNALLDIYAKCNGMKSTNLVFIGLTENHICSWCVIILIGLEAKGYTLVIFVTLAVKSMEFVSKGKILHVPFDPGGSYLGATEYPYHYTTRMKSDKYLSALKRASVKNL
ncbi:pentatricopeptide repeat-containing protein At1g04840-like [Lycium ferocissimum]|uniref:pentatricopeptide repeat-containing protein At1g04840-like n=1 Tax=Lycium ferocissimum TaxID=112874 RepID=UPI002815D412|nr:pentatricopeptide repeat-containing protein At1g04840-like [Lycium ferocissimum]